MDGRRHSAVWGRVDGKSLGGGENGDARSHGGTEVTKEDVTRVGQAMMVHKTKPLAGPTPHAKREATSLRISRFDSR